MNIIRKFRISKLLKLIASISFAIIIMTVVGAKFLFGGPWWIIPLSIGFALLAYIPALLLIARLISDNDSKSLND